MGGRKRTERRVFSKRTVRDTPAAAGMAASVRATRKMELAFAYNPETDRVWLADHHYEIVEEMELEQTKSLIVGYLRDKNVYFCAPWNRSLSDERHRIAESVSRAADSKPPPAEERSIDDHAEAS
jgi:hypothetical protein